MKVMIILIVVRAGGTAATTPTRTSHVQADSNRKTIRNRFKCSNKVQTSFKPGSNDQEGSNVQTVKDNRFKQEEDPNLFRIREKTDVPSSLIAMCSAIRKSANMFPQVRVPNKGCLFRNPQNKSARRS